MHLYLIHLTLADASFPLWLRATHWINVLFFGFMARSGIQILASFPRLYWNRDTKPGTEWLRFTTRKMPTDRVWTSLEEEVEVSPWLAQPGGNSLGLGRHFHFFSLLFWVANGIVYVVLLIASGLWRDIVPTSWSILPGLWDTFVTYATFHVPPAHYFQPYDPMQTVAYGFVVFILAPFQILTGAAQSPAIEGRFPWYSKLWGGRQSARSLHFIGLMAFIGFVIIHTALVIMVCACGPHGPFLPGFVGNMGDIVLGQHTTRHAAAVIVGLAIIFGIIAVYAITTIIATRYPRLAQNALGPVYRPFGRALSTRVKSRQHYSPADISSYHLVNGTPPVTAEYLASLWSNFEGYTIEVGGLVEHPLRLSLADLVAMPKSTQIVQHNCIQGWSSVAEWGGVPMKEIIARVQPRENVKTVVFYSHSQDTAKKQYYETLDLATVMQPQAILAYEMNGEPLPLEHGAPLRLRVDNQLGFKMVKWVEAIEFVESYHNIREGTGGSREDNRHYEVEAGI